MSNKQKALLICAGIFYILVIAGFFMWIPWLALLFLVLHNICLIGFSYLSYHPEDTLRLQGEAEGLRERLKMADEECSRLSASLTELKNTNRDLQARLEAAETDLPKEDSSPADSEASLHQLLPPMEDDYIPGEPIDIIHIARKTMAELASFADAAGIIMQLSTSQSSLYIKASSARIRILFRNIIDNSIKYMNRSGSLVITVSKVGDDIFIVLKDNGKGLALEETAHIFELNYQGSNRISGNGLGLTQAKAIVEAYGGTIYAKSTLNQGMGIYIQIPIS